MYIKFILSYHTSQSTSTQYKKKNHIWHNEVLYKNQ